MIIIKKGSWKVHAKLPNPKKARDVARAWNVAYKQEKGAKWRYYYKAKGNTVYVKTPPTRIKK